MHIKKIYETKHLFIYLFYFIRKLYMSKSQCYYIKKQYKCEKDNPRPKIKLHL